MLCLLPPPSSRFARTWKFSTNIIRSSMGLVLLPVSTRPSPRARLRIPLAIPPSLSFVIGSLCSTLRNRSRTGISPLKLFSVALSTYPQPDRSKSPCSGYNSLCWSSYRSYISCCCRHWRRDWLSIRITKWWVATIFRICPENKSLTSTPNRMSIHAFLSIRKPFRRRIFASRKQRAARFKCCTTRASYSRDLPE